MREQRELDILFGKLKGAEKGSDDYKSAKKAIIDQYGQYLSGLIDEKGEIINLTAAYDRLTEAIRRSARERGIANARQALEDKYTQQTAEDLQFLQKQLENYGISAKEAAETVQQVATAMTSGKDIPQSALKVMEKAYNNMPWYEKYTIGKSNQREWWQLGKPVSDVNHKGPAGIVSRMYLHQGEYDKGMATLDAMEKGITPYKQFTNEYIEGTIKRLERIVKKNKPGYEVVLVEGTGNIESQYVTVDKAKSLIKEYREELAFRGGSSGSDTKEETTPTGSYTPSSSGGGKSKNTAKPDKFAQEKSWREREIALNKIAWLKGEKDYEEYTNRMLEIDVKYHELRLQHTDLEGNERVTIQAEYLEAQKKQKEQFDKWTIEEENQAYADLKRQAQDDYLQKRISTETYNMELENIEMAHMRAMAYITREGTDERKKAEDAYRAALVADQLKRQKEYEDNIKKHQEELKKVYDSYYMTDKEQRDQRYAATKLLIDEVYKQELAKVGENEDKKSEIQKRHAQALKKLYEEIYGDTQEQARSLEDWLGKVLDKLFGEGTWAKYGDVIKNMYASIASVFSSLNQMADAENELRMARLQKYYEREISMAEGNAYKVKQLERKKQKDEAKLKAEASKRQFAQQVISAVAETALAAINAYASASKVSWILGPIAAAMAVAAGGIQIAAIKKQQAASLATGYSKGGFTPAGAVDEPVGVVHAGEWVASQKLLKNPQTRAAIDALDAAQRNNTIGRLGAADVSRTVTAPSVLAGAAADGLMERTMVAMVAVMSRYGDTMERLGDRLDEPFVTVNTVTGDTGIKQAQDEYQRLQNNTLPKSKRR